MYKLKWL